MKVGVAPRVLAAIPSYSPEGFSRSPVEAPSTRAGTVPRVLVAIPCYNEELAIGSLVLQAKRHAPDVLVVDDGSKDRTVEMARAAGAHVMVHDRNLGKGVAIQNAFRHAREGNYDALVLMDGDGQHDPDQIPLFLEPILGRSGHSVDVALGFRFGQNTEMPAWRRVGKRVLDYATAAGGAGTVTDSQCGYRAFGRKAIESMAHRLDATGFGIESEQLVLMKEAGLTAENVAITCKYDGIDGSTKGPVAHATGVLMNLLRMVTERRPLFFIGVPGALLFLAGFYFGLIALRGYLHTGNLRYGMAAFSALDLLLGATMVFTGVMLNVVGAIRRDVDRLVQTVPVRPE